MRKRRWGARLGLEQVSPIWIVKVNYPRIHWQRDPTMCKFHFGGWRRAGGDMLFELSRIMRFTIVPILILSVLAIAQKPDNSRIANPGNSRIENVALWDALIPQIEAELARNKDICEYT